jgi:hypothetical protein
MCYATSISSFEVGGPASAAYRGGVVSQYGVYGSPIVCRWKEPIISRSFGS